jgi:hypothetical protein
MNLVHNMHVESVMPESAVPEQKRNKPRRSLTIDPAIYDWAERVAKSNGLSVSRIIEQALRQRLGAFERDPGEILRAPADSQENP